jgi:hypothetical protein
MPGFVPQRHFRDRPPAVPQHARQRATQLANSVFALFLLWRKKIQAKMSNHVLSQMPRDVFRSIAPELNLLLAIHHVYAGLHVLQNSAINFRVCEHRHRRLHNESSVKPRTSLGPILAGFP